MTSQDPFERSAPRPGDPIDQVPGTPSWAPQAAPSWDPEPSAGTSHEAPSWAPQASAPAQSEYGAPAQVTPTPGISGYGAPADAAQGYAAPGYGTPVPGTPGYSTASPQPYGASAPTYSESGPTETDGFSIAALVTGLLGLSVVAIALGAVGLRRTAQAARKGTWMAVTGLVLGTVSTIAWAVYVTGVVVATADFIESSGLDWEAELSTAQNYGEDPELDALYDACGAGDGQACDDLYWASAYGSEYESFAETCGGRGVPVTGYCADE